MPLDAKAARHWLFGYGSIVNEASRRSTVMSATGSGEEPPPAAWVELSRAAGFVREWNFRCPHGFTALGLRRDAAAATDIGGVFFEADESLGNFDAREAGYERVELAASHLRVLDGHAAAAAVLEQNDPCVHFWTYVPLEASAPNEEHPICQTYGIEERRPNPSP